jgi:outer membrane protein TolC
MAGTEDLTDLLDAETLHRQSQNNLSTAIAAYPIAMVKYKLKVSLGE